MRARNGRKWNVLVAAVVLVAAGCTGDALDDGDSADVVLEVATIPQIPPISTAVSGAGCTFIVTLNHQTHRRRFSAFYENCRRRRFVAEGNRH